MSGSSGRVSSLRRLEEGALLLFDDFFFLLLVDVTATGFGRLETTLDGTMAPEFLERLVRFLEDGMAVGCVLLEYDISSMRKTTDTGGGARLLELTRNSCADDGSGKWLDGFEGTALAIPVTIM